MVKKNAIVVLIVCTILMGVEGKREGFPRPSWSVKYSSGSLRLRPGQWLKIAFLTHDSSQKLATPTISVSGEKFTAIYFDARAAKRSDLLQSMPRSGCGYARNLLPNSSGTPKPESMVATVVARDGFSKLIERVNSRSLVRLVWKDGESEESMAVSVNDCEYSSLLANLRWLVGARWQDVSRELPARPEKILPQ